MNITQEIYKDNIEFLRRVIQLTYEIIDECNHLLFNFLKPVAIPRQDVTKKFDEEKMESIQRNGFRFLSLLYDLSGGEESVRFDMHEIGKRLGYDVLETEYIVETLARSELIRRERNSPNISISSYGIMTINGDINVGYAPVH
ncbi:MAG TPA: hypothetical protein VNN20_07835 [Thermodesulfobacteriota bacterium]|nr:hypothetical protein [Thermodesulfobacteriota bacterium]